MFLKTDKWNVHLLVEILISFSCSIIVLFVLSSHDSIAGITADILITGLLLIINARQISYLATKMNDSVFYRTFTDDSRMFLDWLEYKYPQTYKAFNNEASVSVYFLSLEYILIELRKTCLIEDEIPELGTKFYNVMFNLGKAVKYIESHDLEVSFSEL